jgi:cytochrome c oxidase subunit 2
MFYLLIAALVLLLVVVGLLVRAQVLIDVFTRSSDKRAGMSNKINAFLFPVFFVSGLIGFIYLSWTSRADYLPEASSLHGVRTDELFWITMGIITVVFILSHVLLFFFPYVYQFNEKKKALFYPVNHRLEFIWTVIPAIVLALLVFSGWKVWSDITKEAPEDAVVVEIIGKQFNWMVRYPGKDLELGSHNFRKIDELNTVGIDFADKKSFDDFMSGEVRIPVGKPILFKIRARDVLHSVFAPHFRLKMDAVPGMPTKFWFVPTKTSAQMKTELGNPDFTYEIACTEVCGRGHFGMRLPLVVVEEDEYETWFKTQQSFLAKNPDYLKKVPDNLKKLAEESIIQNQKSIKITAFETPITQSLANIF